MKKLRQGQKRKPLLLAQQPVNAVWSDLEQFGPEFLSKIEAALGKPLSKTNPTDEAVTHDPLQGWGVQFLQVYDEYIMLSQTYESLPAPRDARGELKGMAKSCGDLLSRLGQTSKRGPLVVIPDTLHEQLSMGIANLKRVDPFWRNPMPMPEALASIEAMIAEFRGKVGNVSRNELENSGYHMGLLNDLLHQICVVATEATPFQTVDYIVPLLDRLESAAKMAASYPIARPANAEVQLVGQLAALFVRITGEKPPTLGNTNVDSNLPWQMFLKAFGEHTGIQLSLDDKRAGTRAFLNLQKTAPKSAQKHSETT